MKEHTREPTLETGERGSIGRAPARIGRISRSRDRQNRSFMGCGATASIVNMDMEQMTWRNSLAYAHHEQAQRVGLFDRLALGEEDIRSIASGQFASAFTAIALLTRSSESRQAYFGCTTAPSSS